MHTDQLDTSESKLLGRIAFGSYKQFKWVSDYEMRILLCLMLSAVVVFPLPAASAEETRATRWHEDLQVLAEVGGKAKPFEDQHKKQTFLRAIAQLGRTITSKSDAQMLVEIMKVVAIAGDSHTSVNFARFGLHIYPLQLYWFKEGLYVTKAAAGNEQLLGAKLIKVNYRTTKRALGMLRDILPHENDSVFKAFAPQYLTLGEVLEGLGLARNPLEGIFTFRLPDGRNLEVKLEASGATPNWSSAKGAGELRYANPGQNYCSSHCLRPRQSIFSTAGASRCGICHSLSFNSNCWMPSTRKNRCG